uniref:DRIL1/2 protein dead ringer homolog n=1 Tax=Phallusia mammillata TaxID=59560 RepID=A0A6F9D7J6_9ASCI|nr:DRIL1/2 protein dead ringer homolog [Phallusia mammillata]
MMVGNLAQAKADIGLAGGIGSAASANNVSAATMKLEAVMENLQRQHQQRLIEQHKVDDVMTGGDDFSDSSDHRRRSYSESPKGGSGGADESGDEDGRQHSPMGMMKDDDDVTNGGGSPVSERSSALMAQQVAFAAALAQRSSPESNAPASLNSFMPQAMLQQFGQFQNNLASFDPSQLPQGFRELALLQHQQMAQRMAVEAQKRLQEQQNLQQQQQQQQQQLPHHPQMHTPAPSHQTTQSNASSNSSMSSGMTSQSKSASSGGGTNQQEWTYEEQFKQLYEIDSDPKRKEFLDELFSFMQKRGTPVNRIPIMAKQVLDLYQLYKLVVEKGGLVEVINKKIWREITKGLNLPSSITSAAFTLRTQYMKYLYPFECEREKLSCPSELQAAIEGNRREGRRPSYSSHMFSYPPSSNGANMLTPPKFPFPPHNGLGQLTSLAAKYGQSDERMLPTSPTQQLIAQQQQLLQSANAQHVAAMAALESIQNQAKVRAAHAAQQAAQHAAQQAAQHQMSLKKEIDSDYSEGELPPEKKMCFDDSARRLSPDEPRRISSSSRSSLKMSMSDRGESIMDVFAVLPYVFWCLVFNVKMMFCLAGKQGDMNEVSNCDSIDMSVEVNGITYQGVLFAQYPNNSPLKQSTPPPPHNST